MFLFFWGGFEAQMDLELIQQVQLMRLHMAAWEMKFSQHLEIWAHSWSWSFWIQVDLLRRAFGCKVTLDILSQSLRDATCRINLRLLNEWKVEAIHASFCVRFGLDRDHSRSQPEWCHESSQDSVAHLVKDMLMRDESWMEKSWEVIPPFFFLNLLYECYHVRVRFFQQWTHEINLLFLRVRKPVLLKVDMKFVVDKGTGMTAMSFHYLLCWNLKDWNAVKRHAFIQSPQGGRKGSNPKNLHVLRICGRKHNLAESKG